MNVRKLKIIILYLNQKLEKKMFNVKNISDISILENRHEIKEFFLIYN